MVVLLALSACTGPPPAPDTLFQDARALAVTPDGTLWVVDADAVLAFRDTSVIRRIGGVGTGDDAFLDPVDVDPTNGQTIYVADRAAGAILQFTAEGRLVRSLRVPDVDPADVLRQSGASRLGQPVAVAAGAGGALYVAEAGRGHVLELDSEGAVVRVIGAGLLSDPVDLAIDDDGTLWVADAGRGGLQSFDLFGGASRFREVGGFGRVVGVAVGPQGGTGMAERGGITFDGSAERRLWQDVHAVRADGSAFGAEPFRGVAYDGGRLLALTATRVAVLGNGDRGLD